MACDPVGPQTGIPLQVASCARRSTASPGRLGYAIVDIWSPTWLLDRLLVIRLARRLVQVWPGSGEYRSRHYHVRYWSNSDNKLLRRWARAGAVPKEGALNQVFLCKARISHPVA